MVTTSTILYSVQYSTYSPLYPSWASLTDRLTISSITLKTKVLKSSL